MYGHLGQAEHSAACCVGTLRRQLEADTLGGGAEEWATNCMQLSTYVHLCTLRTSFPVVPAVPVARPRPLAPRARARDCVGSSRVGSGPWLDRCPVRVCASAFDGGSYFTNRKHAARALHCMQAAQAVMPPDASQRARANLHLTWAKWRLSLLERGAAIFVALEEGDTPPHEEVRCAAQRPLALALGLALAWKGCTLQ